MALSKITNASLSTGIDATKLADGSVTSTELQYINSLSSNAQSQISGVGGGKVLQVVSTQMTATTSGTSHNAWADSALTATITPTATTSKIMVMVNFTINMTNSSGNGGYSVRLKQAISGGATTYPEALSSGIPAGGYHTYAYNGEPYSGAEYRPANFHGVTGAIGTTSAVTFTLQYGTYSLEGAGIGDIGGKQTITMIELGA
jgi:hypothetical protein